MSNKQIIQGFYGHKTSLSSGMGFGVIQMFERGKNIGYREKK